MPQVRARAVAVGMASLDGLDLHAIFRRRAVVMRTVPTFLKGVFTAAFRVAFDECIAARAHGDETWEVRAWKLFLLIPRMLLHRPPRGGLVPRKRLEERLRSFEAGEWESLVLQSIPGAEQAANASARRRRRERTGDVERRAARAVRLVQMGELSAGRQALEGAEVAPGSRRTLDKLRDPVRRPPEPREPLPQAISSARPAQAFILDDDLFRDSKFAHSLVRVAASGPFGMRLRPLVPIVGQ